MMIFDVKNQRVFSTPRYKNIEATFQYETPNLVRVSYKSKSGKIKRVMLKKSELVEQ